MSEIDRIYTESRNKRVGVFSLTFTSSLLVIMGIFRIIDAIWAFKYNDDIPGGIQTIVFDTNLAAWGWIWLILGILMIVAGYAFVKGMEWARWFGVAVLAIAAVSNYSWIVFRPFWTLVLEGIYLAGIYGLLVYGGKRDPLTP